MRRSINSSLGIAAFLGLALLLSACRSPFNGAKDAWSEQSAHPITVETHLVSQQFHIGPDGTELRQDDRDLVAALAADYRGRGIGKLTVSAPKGSSNAQAAVSIAAEVTDIAEEQGVAPREVDIAGYRAPADKADAPIIVSYSVYEAKPSECGNWTKNYAFAPLNHVTPDHGCATQNNLAALGENPRDLVTPRTEQGPDQPRRATVLDQYRKGAVTSSAKDEQAAGAVSELNK